MEKAKILSKESFYMNFLDVIKNIVHLENANRSFVYCHWKTSVTLDSFFNPVLATSRHCTDIRMTKHIGYVIGASVFVRRDFLQDIGLMCEDYFLYCEEIDWAERAKGKYKIACVPESIVYHKEGASTGGQSVENRTMFSDYYQLRSRILFTKNFTRSIYL